MCFSSSSSSSSVLFLSVYLCSVQFKEKFGHCNVPRSEKDKTYYALSRWVERQRYNYKSRQQKAATGIKANRRDVVMTDEQVQKLNSLGSFRWEKGKRKNALFEARCTELATYAAANGGNTRAPCGTPLGDWLSKMRSEYRAKKLAPEQIAKLNSINMDWLPSRSTKFSTQPPAPRYVKKRAGCSDSKSKKKGRPKEEDKNASFETRFHELAAYAAAHGGNTRVPGNTLLGQWVQKVRCDYEAGKLAPERVAKLNSIQFDWLPLYATGRKPQPKPEQTQAQPQEQKDESNIVPEDKNKKEEKQASSPEKEEGATKKEDSSKPPPTAKLRYW